MGSDPYWYYVPYEEDFNAALQKLREREFTAGRYNPVMMFPEFPITETSPCPGNQHGSIQEAIEDAMEDGTRSILDLCIVSDQDIYCVARTLSNAELMYFFGTTTPDKSALERCLAGDCNATGHGLHETIGRGKGVCIPVYDQGSPKELFFLGFSVD